MKNTIDGILIIALLAIVSKIFLGGTGIGEGIIASALSGLLGFRFWLDFATQEDPSQAVVTQMNANLHHQNLANNELSERLQKLEGTIGSMNLTKFKSPDSIKKQFGW